LRQRVSKTKIVNKKETIMSKTTKNPYGIKTPKSVNEYRKNLKKYYITIPIEYDKNTDRKDVPIEGLYLYVREKEIPLTDIDSFSDIYKITKTGFSGNGSSPNIIPMITPRKEVMEYMRETDQLFSTDGYFYDESNFTIWEDVDEFRKDGNPMWYSLDNQWLREFYMITLGEYGG
jgi:hypothetical protein